MTPPGFTGSRLDRADPIRQDAAALAAILADPAARLLRLDGLDPVIAGEDGPLEWGPLDDAPEAAFLAFLGLLDGAPRFVALPDAPIAGSAQRSPLVFRLLDAWPPEEAATYAAARSLVDWHGRHLFCARCGVRTEPVRGGWSRRCPSCATEHFPRVDPVVIMLAEHEGRVLVGRQASWAQGRYSALAGFVEPGESIEEAVAREVHEEAGVRVTDVRYLASQPWPFPSQLMIACVARAADDRITIDPNELEAAMWVDRDGVRAALAKEPGAPFDPPPPYAIANSLFRLWLGEA